jgi:SAM-dependent methyltransferase
MHTELLQLLIDPVTKGSLRLQVDRKSGDDVIEGSLASDSSTYPITNGIPRFVTTCDHDQHQTAESFAFQWKLRESYDSVGRYEMFRPWLIRRYGFSEIKDMTTYFMSRHRILDAGCGSGFSSSQWLTHNNRAQWIGVEISDAIDVAKQRLAGIPNTHFVQADIFQLPFRASSFDTIFSEGVLHHTPSTEEAFKRLIPLLERGGEILFYVYRKKGPIREFSDDHIRELVSKLPPEEAWNRLRPLTRLAETLAKLKVNVEVPEDIDYLDIKAGRYDIQRLIYWHFMKLFWNDKMSFEENNHVNFDWYHPRYAHRQTESEIRHWCSETGLSIDRFNTEESGFTIRARKPR